MTAESFMLTKKHRPRRCRCGGNWQILNEHGAIEMTNPAMKTNDLKRGQLIRLENGWFAILDDNRQGNTRMAIVDGFHRELGSVYSHDIAWWRYPDNMRVADMPTGELMNIGAGEFKGFYGKVEHTAAQEKLRGTVERFFQ